MSADARRYLIAVVLLAILGGTAEFVRVNRVPPAAYHPTFAEVPRQVGEYRGEDLPIQQSVYSFLAAGGMLEREYRGPDRVPVRLTLVYAPDWRSIHSPEACLPNQGWQVLEEQIVQIAPPPGFPLPGPLEAKIITLQKDKQRLLALFSFAYKGGTTANWGRMSLGVVRGPRGAGGLLFTMYTPVDKPGRGAAQRLQAIFEGTYPGAVAFWYQPPSSPR